MTTTDTATTAQIHYLTKLQAKWLEMRDIIGNVDNEDHVWMRREDARAVVRDEWIAAGEPGTWREYRKSGRIEEVEAELREQAIAKNAQRDEAAVRNLDGISKAEASALIDILK